MRLLCLYLSLFCGILGGIVSIRLLYSAVVTKFSKAYEKRKTKVKSRKLI